MGDESEHWRKNREVDDEQHQKMEKLRREDPNFCFECLRFDHCGKHGADVVRFRVGPPDEEKQPEERRVLPNHERLMKSLRPIRIVYLLALTTMLVASWSIGALLRSWVVFGVLVLGTVIFLARCYRRDAKWLRTVTSDRL